VSASAARAPGPEERAPVHVILTTAAERHDEAWSRYIAACEAASLIYREAWKSAQMLPALAEAHEAAYAAERIRQVAWQQALAEYRAATRPGRDWRQMSPGDFGKPAPPAQEPLFPLPDSCGSTATFEEPI
jgi:hypothetical protein